MTIKEAIFFIVSFHLASDLIGVKMLNCLALLKLGRWIKKPKQLFMAIAIGIVASLPPMIAGADSGVGARPHENAYEQPGHTSIGRPAAGADITRTIEVNIKETESGYMLFEPDVINIEHGSVVRFVVDNSGSIDHEFFLGSFDEIAKHQQWMQKHPDMEHSEKNSVKIPSAKTATLDWEFSNITNLEFVCLIPGHREAGMFGVIIVHDHFRSRP
ncbi:cupredoxin domain-containing protein [Roseobacter litoralis]|uniref:Cupredoxin-like protein n=1 Tax=Roseobacter litoralis (strain ATCC 49566 / DSM 6996 / JCM 21268 / NBRC 15278 / OCh 149) TaxID=391595 RepID=F7ZMF7_ROSLO|nr:plastocyanin/azurin family copper-binding protein [Roseobacter litoralis]AEI96494.1 cupredoxin-like protein [Roseobacter litoralis Och 149]